MDPAIVSALSAVFGSAVGGSASIATAWVTQRTQGKRELLRAEVRKRESLYRAFIAECSKLVVDAIDHTLDSPEKLVEVYALQNQIRLMASEAVVIAAEQATNLILKKYLEADHKGRDVLQSLADGGRTYDDPLRPFSEACRNELKAMQRLA
jgi:hypothetical protein